MIEYKSPVLFKLGIEHEPRSRLAHELREQPPSLRERLEPQVLPVKLEDIKRAEMHVATTAAQVLKFGKTSFGAGDGLPVDQACGGLERPPKIFFIFLAPAPYPKNYPKILFDFFCPRPLNNNSIGPSLLPLLKAMGESNPPARAL